MRQRKWVIAKVQLGPNLSSNNGNYTTHELVWAHENGLCDVILNRPLSSWPIPESSRVQLRGSAPLPGALCGGPFPPWLSSFMAWEGIVAWRCGPKDCVFVGLCVKWRCHFHLGAFVWEMWERLWALEDSYLLVILSKITCKKILPRWCCFQLFKMQRHIHKLCKVCDMCPSRSVKVFPFSIMSVNLPYFHILRDNLYRNMITVMKNWFRFDSFVMALTIPSAAPSSTCFYNLQMRVRKSGIMYFGIEDQFSIENDDSQ